MNGSLSRRLFLWLSASITVMGVAMTALSFALSYAEANDEQDAQLKQVAALLSTRSAMGPDQQFVPRNGEDAEAHYVVHALGSGRVDPNPKIDLLLPAGLPHGLQSIVSSNVEWRVMVTRDAARQEFAVAQRQPVRNEFARDSAVLTLVPTLMLLPLLLLIVRFVLRQGFAPLVALSKEVDQVEGERLVELNAAGIPLEAAPLVHAVNRLLARLGTALDQQRRMVADAAHELRTPVAAARVQSDNLAHANMPPEALTRLHALQRGLQRISELIEQLLKLARVQDVAHIADKPVSFDTAVRSAIEETLALAESHGVDLGCLRLDQAEIRGDRSHVYALTRNAIDNAVRYSPQGGAVDVSVEVQDGQVLLTVEDTGPGIERAHRERVFEPFFRILGSQQSGSGLGLAIVRSAANALGGTVNLEARPDGQRGLRFTYRQKVA